MVNPIQVVFGLLLTLFIPGYTLVQVLFPRKGELDEEFDNLYRFTLSIALSIALVIVMGFFLGHPDVRLFTLWPIVLTLSSISLILFTMGWWRGAYPWIGILFPILLRIPPGLKPETEELMEDKNVSEVLLEIQSLAYERRGLKRKIKDLEMKSRASVPSIGKYYQTQKKKYLLDIGDIDAKLAALEEKRAQEIR